MDRISSEKNIYYHSTQAHAHSQSEGEREREEEEGGTHTHTYTTVLVNNVEQPVIIL